MKRFIFLTILIFISLILISSFFAWLNIYLPLDFSDGKEAVFLVQKGEGLFAIADNLEKGKIIRSKYFFNLYVYIKRDQSELQAGEYFLSSSMNVPEIAKKIISGDVNEEKITIPEGWNIRDIAWYFEGRGMFQAEELFELIGFPLIDYSGQTDLPELKDFSQDYDFLRDKPKNVNLEGYLFPDTYFVQKSALHNRQNLEEIIGKMLDNFDIKLTQDLRDETVIQEKTIFEIITMASLLEKEVKTFEDKKMVSGILWKRLKTEFPLQVDATISYITGKRTTKVSIEETKINSPYNTYKYQGLPLGPICNPGLESILASLYPESSEYWYYLSTPEGMTIFSKTLQEHNIAKEKYLK